MGKATSFLSGNMPEPQKVGLTAFQCSGGFVQLFITTVNAPLHFVQGLTGIYLKWEWGKKKTSINHFSFSSICWLSVWIQKFHLIIQHLRAILGYCSGLDCICEKKMHNENNNKDVYSLCHLQSTFEVVGLTVKC